MAQVTVCIGITQITDRKDGTVALTFRLTTPGGAVLMEYEKRGVFYRDESGKAKAEILDFGQPIPGYIQQAEKIPLDEIAAIIGEKYGIEVREV